MAFPLILGKQQLLCSTSVNHLAFPSFFLDATLFLAIATVVEAVIIGGMSLGYLVLSKRKAVEAGAA